MIFFVNDLKETETIIQTTQCEEPADKEDTTKADNGDAFLMKETTLKGTLTSLPPPPNIFDEDFIFLMTELTFITSQRS